MIETIHYVFTVFFSALEKMPAPPLNVPGYFVLSLLIVGVGVSFMRTKDWKVY